MAARARSHQIIEGILIPKRLIVQVVDFKPVFATVAFADHAAMHVNLKALKPFGLHMGDEEIYFCQSMPHLTPQSS
jgi:hypothetical protein